MKSNIRKLKDLMIVYECAINYDYVPPKDKAQELIDEVLPSYLNVELSQLQDILTEYEGRSDGDIVSLTMDAIHNLKEQ